MKKRRPSVLLLLDNAFKKRKPSGIYLRIEGQYQLSLSFESYLAKRKRTDRVQK